MNDDAYLDKDEQDAAGEESLKDDIPDTGGLETILIEEIPFSDIVDASDPEEMDEFADEVDPANLPGTVDEDGVEMAKYSTNKDILEDLIDRQQISAGTEQLMSDLKNHTGESPQTSADDIDAGWDIDHQSGEESVGASVATPEQNIVAELGEAVGLEYKDGEELNTEDKINARDENRWELSAESMDDDDDLDEDDASDENEEDEFEDSDLFDDLALDQTEEDDDVLE